MFEIKLNFNTKRKNFLLGLCIVRKVTKSFALQYILEGPTKTFEGSWGWEPDLTAPVQYISELSQKYTKNKGEIRTNYCQA